MPYTPIRRMNTRKSDALPLLLMVLAVLSYGRILILQGVHLDDNCWLLGVDTSNTLQEFLANGFSQLRREPLGVFLYFFFLPHRWIGEHAVQIWHGITLVVQIVTPLVLYQFLRNLTSGRRDIAGFVAITLVVAALDQTAPFLSAINYRIGLLLGLISLYLTERAAREEQIDRKKIFLALFAAAIGEYIFIEAVIAFEPARLLLLWIVRGRSMRVTLTAMRHVFAAWFPFVVVPIPLIVYKLVSKTFGVYSGMYATDIANLTNWIAAYDTLGLFAFGNWSMLQKFAAQYSVMSLMFVLAAGAAVFYVLQRIGIRQASQRTSAGSEPWGVGGEATGPRVVVLLGIVLLIPQIIFFGIAGRFPGVGDRTTHAVLMQAGYAMILGTGLWWFINRFLIAVLKVKPLLPHVLFAAFTGLGTYYNNLNLDMYVAATERENEFWRAFTSRFPVFPERADLFVDALPRPYAGGVQTFFLNEGLQGACGFEFHLNRFYAARDKTAGLRRYRVLPMRQFIPYYRRGGSAILGKTIQITTNFGTEFLNPGAFIVVYYRNGELLVNREIVDRYPSIPYRLWADKPPPIFRAPGEE